MTETIPSRLDFTDNRKEIVDFLFTLLSLPVGTIIRLLSETGMVGSIGNLYKSVENLDYTYLQPSVHKNSLLIPKSLVSGPNILNLTNNNVNSTSPKVLYICSKTTYSSYEDGARVVHPYVTEDPNERCPKCSKPMSIRTIYVGEATTTVESSDGEADGYVKGVVTYMIMDNLEVTPMSTISSITMLNKFDIKYVGALEEKVVELTMHEGVKLLKESLQS